ncbi:YfbK domain-containing protein, partial [Conchiformibius steedae]|uniref:YfbK domain-containing protein n=1 Tax=Conchiformibius steedae TaxID=153493 RepID=UPI0026F37236
FALAAAAYAQQLKGGKYNGNMGWREILHLAQQSARPDRHGLRQEFLDLIKTAQSLSAQTPQQ